MITRRHVAALLLPLPALALAACDAAHAPAPSGDPTPADSGAAAPDSTTPADGQTASGSVANANSPDLTPAPLTPEAERGEKGARNVLLAFGRAIELKQFDQAYGLLRSNTREGMIRAQFAAHFDGLGAITFAAPEGTLEGAAGTSYYTAPVTITGSSGRELTGQIVLNRVNDVPGATPEQLRWRVRTLDLSD